MWGIYHTVHGLFGNDCCSRFLYDVTTSNPPLAEGIGPGKVFFTAPLFLMVKYGQLVGTHRAEKEI